MRKLILKGTTLKSPFHITLFGMKLRSHCTFFNVEFLKEPIYSSELCLLTLLVFLNVLLFWFPADQGLKKVGFITLLKLVKISYYSE